jgi:hypothetical protein
MTHRHPFLPPLAAAGVLAVMLACGVTAPLDSNATATAQAGQTQQQLQLEEQQQQMQQTGEALHAAATSLSATQTFIARPTPTASVTPGPVVIRDDFNQDTGRWTECDYCSLRDGVLYLGPVPSSDSARGYYAICKDCGQVEYFKMSVDAQFVEGASDRGFGLLYDESRGDYRDLEILTWQLYGLWHYDPTLKDSWDAWSTDEGYQAAKYLRAGRQLNHIEMKVEPYDHPHVQNTCEDRLSIYINGKFEHAVYIECKSGRVGLMVGLHSLGVSFDNFYFEAIPVPGSGGVSGF